MPITQVNRRGQVTIPAEIRKRLSLDKGAYVEVTTDGKTIMLKPAATEHDPAVEAALTEGLKDVQEGRTYGPFESVEEMKEHFKKHPPHED